MPVAHNIDRKQNSTAKMATATAPYEEFLEPVKYNPLDAKQRAAREDAFMQYKNIAGANPFNAKPSFRDQLEERGCRTHHAVKFEGQKEPKDAAARPDGFGAEERPRPQQQHPALRPKPSQQQLEEECQKTIDDIVFGHKIPASTTSLSVSDAKTSATPQGLRTCLPHHGMSKSVSEAHLGKPRGLFETRDGSPQRSRKASPFPIAFESPSKHQLDPIEEELARNYKVKVRCDPDSEAKVVRSPLKKLFGEGGLLGRATSAKDLHDPRFKKSSFVQWSTQIKERIESATRDVTERSQKRVSMSAGAGRLPVSLSPYFQGDFYMQLELLLSIEVNKFLMREFNEGRVSAASVRTITEQWTKKGRPQVLGFRFDLATQRELVNLNSSTIEFSNVRLFGEIKLLSVLAAWKVLAREMAVRTFCQPDSAVKKHLHDAEKVLELIGASCDSMLAFQEMRGRVVAEMYREEKRDQEHPLVPGITRAWSPSKQYRTTSGH